MDLISKLSSRECERFKQNFLPNQDYKYETYIAARKFILEIQESESIKMISERYNRSSCNFNFNTIIDMWDTYVISIGKPEEVKSKRKPIITNKPIVDTEKQNTLSNRLSKGEASKQLQCATQMPPLRHKLAAAGEKFDVTQSEVSSWLMQQPDIMQYVFTRIKNSGFIVYDSETNTWQGRDYKKAKPYREGGF